MESSFTKGPAGEVASTESTELTTTELAAGEVAPAEAPAEVTAASTAHVNSAATTTHAAGKG